MTSRYRLSAAAAGVVVTLVVAPGGCASPSSPKEKLIESADGTCDTLSERFGKGGDLAYGKTVGGDDLKKMAKRSKLIKELARETRDMPKPKSGRKKLDAWLAKLDDFAKETEELRANFVNARPGHDMLLIMKMAIVDDAAKATGPAAKSFGFESCADVGAWRNFPKK